VKVLHQVFLAKLAEGEAIKGQVLLEALEPANLPAEWMHRYATFDFDKAFVDPIEAVRRLGPL
jgi:hypothetical protein